MATKAATKRLTKEYATITANPPPYIVAHPSESNILEWHYILTGPPDTPYAGGQYWGTLQFPPNYPFAPPAIRMHTPSGRFQPSTRLCLSISDFHPKSFNPAWEVSTILIGLMSFMTGEEMTTGSVSASESERKLLAARTRWWNSTGGGSTKRTIDAAGNVVENGPKTASASSSIRAGDGGAKFRAEWQDVDNENWKMMAKERIDVVTGFRQVVSNNTNCAPGMNGLRRRPTGAGGNSSGLGTVMEGIAGREAAGQSWIRRNKMALAAFVLFGYVLVTRLMSADFSTEA